MFVDIICVRDKKKKIQAKKNYLHGKQQVLHSIMLTPPGGGALDFKWQEWLKDFLGFEIFDCGIFLG